MKRGRKVKYKTMPDKLLKAYIEGKKTRADLARKMNVCEATLYRILKRSGYLPLGKRGRKKKVFITDDTIQKLLNGETTFALEKDKINVSYKTYAAEFHARLGFPKYEEYKKIVNEMRSKWRTITDQETIKKNRERRLMILQEANNGSTLQQLADKHGITRERIRQILKKESDCKTQVIPCSSCQRLLQCRVGPAICPDCLLKGECHD